MAANFSSAKLVGSLLPAPDCSPAFPQHVLLPLPCGCSWSQASRAAQAAVLLFLKLCEVLTHNLGNAHVDLQLEGVFAQNWPFENGPEMYFGGDASVGPYSADPRKRKVAFAVLSLINHSVTGVWPDVGSMTANLPGQVQKVPLGEAFTLLHCLKATLNSFCFVIDAQYVHNRARKLSKNCVATFTHPDVQTEITELSRDRPGRLKMHNIKSHLTREQWRANNGEDELWQWLANKEADKLCSNKAATLAGKQASSMQD